MRTQRLCRTAYSFRNTVLRSHALFLNFRQLNFSSTLCGVSANLSPVTKFPPRAIRLSPLRGVDALEHGEEEFPAGLSELAAEADGFSFALEFDAAQIAAILPIKRH